MTTPALAQQCPVQEDQLLPSSGAGQEYGQRVAISGDIAVVGGEGESDSSNEGVFVFRKAGQLWAEEAELVPTNPPGNDYFGDSVAVCGDFAVVGAPRDDSVMGDTGLAYVFRHTGGGTWVEESQLFYTNMPFGGDLLGQSVAICGNVAVVAAPKRRISGLLNVGAVYVFRRAGDGTWTEEAKLKPNDPTADDSFGHTIAISGNVLAISSNSGSGSFHSASVYLFRDTGGGNWVQETKLTVLDEEFGCSIALDGDLLLVGAQGAENGVRTNSGAVYIFRDMGAGTWAQEDRVVSSDNGVIARFGHSVAAKQGFAVIGADDVFTPDSGMIYVFEDQGGGSWIEDVKYQPAPALIFDKFGETVALDGDTAIVGTNGFNGGAYVVDLAGTCQADMDGDCDYDGIDIGLFLSAYVNQLPPGDIDNDGDWDVTDVGLFLSDYATGCF